MDKSALPPSYLIGTVDRFHDKKNKAAGMDVLARHAAAIRMLRDRTAQYIIKIGERLTAAKKICGHGNWLPWLEREFGWTDETARNFMNVYQLAGSNPKRVWDLNLPLSSLYLIARPSTPEAIREEVLGRADRGEPPSLAQVKAVIAGAKKDKGRARPIVVPEEPRPPAGDDFFEEVVEWFRRLDRHAQGRYLIRLRNIAAGKE
jgi:Protein of unknown function (DUF3102)